MHDEICICYMKGHFDLFFDITRDHADLAGWALNDAAQWGHIPYVELLLQHRTDICTSDAGWALGNAAKGEHHSRNYISADNVGWALIYAAKNGQTPIVELLLQSRNDISADLVSRALHFAAEAGHTRFYCLIS
jgi:hypothetical protein